MIYRAAYILGGHHYREFLSITTTGDLLFCHPGQIVHAVCSLPAAARVPVSHNVPPTLWKVKVFKKEKFSESKVRRDQS
jgi:hypothetical protein